MSIPLSSLNEVVELDGASLAFWGRWGVGGWGGWGGLVDLVHLNYI